MDQIEEMHFIGEMIDYSQGKDCVNEVMSRYNLKNNSKVIYGVTRINYKEE